MRQKVAVAAAVIIVVEVVVHHHLIQAAATAVRLRVAGVSLLMRNMASCHQSIR